MCIFVRLRRHVNEVNYGKCCSTLLYINERHNNQASHENVIELNICELLTTAKRYAGSHATFKKIYRACLSAIEFLCSDTIWFYESERVP